MTDTDLQLREPMETEEKPLCLGSNPSRTASFTGKNGDSCESGTDSAQNAAESENKMRSPISDGVMVMFSAELSLPSSTQRGK